MYTLVGFQTALLSEFLFTHITRIWALTAMYALMYYQSAVLSEFLFTHITRIWALTAMYALMCYQSGLFSEFLFYTNHKSMGAHHYVLLDVLLECSVV